MNLRDSSEELLRRWNAYELNRGAPAVIDFDCVPNERIIHPASDRLAVYEELMELYGQARREWNTHIERRLWADICYLRAVLGERFPLDEYVWNTQGCGVQGWPQDYINAKREYVQGLLADLGISWGSSTDSELYELEGPVNFADAGAVIRAAAQEWEQSVRDVTGATASYELSIVNVTVDDYWAYWVDGSGRNVRLRLNDKNATFTQVRARQFALHEILGHGLQSANYSQRYETEDVPWIRLLSVHSPAQVLLEGLAQALPLFVAPDDAFLAARVHLSHYLELVRSVLHVHINEGVRAETCAMFAREFVPFWSDEDIADELRDRGQNPLLRSYLWSYAAGIDWFVALSRQPRPVWEKVLRSAYQQPLTPSDLSELWPDGPTFGGPGSSS